MTQKTIRDLFDANINRRIEEVIKVDQTTEEVLQAELAEYVMTESITSHYKEVLESYWEMPKKPHEGIAVWVSGFFGSGKSSFAKYLGLALENRTVLGDGTAEVLSRRNSDPKFQVLLKNIGERIPTEAVIFDVSTERGIRTGNQSITEIMYRLFLQHLGYARDLDLAELEIALEADGRLGAFKDKYRKLFKKDWDEAKGKIAFAVQEASRVMQELEPGTYPTADSWRESASRRTDITAGDLAKRCLDLMGRRRNGKSLLFVIDEVGQFVARDRQKMLDLQGVVQSLGRLGRGKMWIVVTSQEKLSELVSGLEGNKVEFARLMDRFPLQVHLEPSDISEVTSQRVLSKNAEAQKSLRELFTQHRSRLTDNTRLSADIKLPELSTETFVDLYPLLPYQIDLIIQIVSGLRMQGGASKHVGGANRTIIKIAQQLLIHPDVDLGSEPVGRLARIDQIYDLVSGNISSEFRGKIDEIEKKVAHPLAQKAAKAVCLLQFVQSVHRTPENIAAALHSSVDADSALSEVRAALQALERSQMVRRGDDGYRIPTPAEDDWERQRLNLEPKPSDITRIHKEAIKGLWQPPPSHTFREVRRFTAGLVVNDDRIEEGDTPFHVTLAESDKDYAERVEESRQRSRTETKSVFWVAQLGDAVDREAVEVYRSREILSRKERGAQTKDETALVGEEKRRMNNRHLPELRRLLKEALLSGVIFFRGNDRSPTDDSSELGKAANKVLSQALPEIFDRFEEAAARVAKSDLDRLMTTEDLRGLTSVFADLGLVRDQSGKTVINTETGPLREILSRIENRTSYGEVATGRYLTDEFSKEPFGWDFDIVRLFVVALLRAGKIESTSKGQVIDSALSLDARNTFANNNLFRQASFRPKVGLEFTHIAEASQSFQDTFGREVRDLEQGAVATAIREEVGRHEADLAEVHTQLVQHGLPGAEVLKAALDQIRSLRSGREDQTILSFHASHKQLKEAIRRGAELSSSLTEIRLHDLARARRALGELWPSLEAEPDLPEEVKAHAKVLDDLMRRETFFRDLAAIDQHAQALEVAFEKRHGDAVRACIDAYTRALDELRSTPGWEQLKEEERQRVHAPLAAKASEPALKGLTIPHLRTEVHACPGHLKQAVHDMLRMLDGNRVVCLSAASYFSGGIETEEQLAAALEGLRDRCMELIGAGKKVLVQ